MREVAGFFLQGATGFLEKAGAGEGASLLLGSLLEVVVRDAADKRMIRAVVAAAEKQGSTKEWPGLTIGERDCLLASPLSADNR